MKKFRYQCTAVVDLIRFWASNNHEDTNKGQRLLHTLYGYQIQLGIWETLQSPQWVQGEALIEGTRRIREQKNETPENCLKLYQDKNFALFYIKFKPTKEKFRLLLLFWTTAYVDKFCIFSASRKISQVSNAKTYSCCFYW